MPGIAEYQKIKNDFINESNIQEIDPNMRYKIQERNDDYTILSYGNDEKNSIKVPNELIPFWANNESTLYYKDRKFNRDL